MNTTTQLPKLSHLAESILDDKWILCSPAEAIANAVHEYIDHLMGEYALPFTYNDVEVTTDEFTDAIGELVAYFMVRGDDA